MLPFSLVPIAGMLNIARKDLNNLLLLGFSLKIFKQVHPTANMVVTLLLSLILFYFLKKVQLSIAKHENLSYSRKFQMHVETLSSGSKNNYFIHRNLCIRLNKFPEHVSAFMEVFYCKYTQISISFQKGNANK